MDRETILEEFYNTVNETVDCYDANNNNTYVQFIIGVLSITNRLLDRLLDDVKK